MAILKPLLLVSAAIVASVNADFQYRSRPDLSPPILNITTPAQNGIEKGLIFVTPYQGFTPGHYGPEQDGAYIFRDNGDLVWSGVGFTGGWSIDFRPDTWKGQTILRAFQGSLKPHGRMYGSHVILNNRYEIIKTVHPVSTLQTSAHEFRILPDGERAIVEAPIARVRDLSQYGGQDPRQRWIRSAAFQEIDIESGEVLFEWESLDHVDPAYCAFPLPNNTERSLGGTTAATADGTGFNTTDAWNYFHINSVDKNADGDYLVSGRNYAAVFKVSGKTGEIIWQLGGLHGGSTFDIDPDAKFAFQHHARFRSQSEDGSIEVISLFDNGAHSNGAVLRNVSLARYIQLNHTSKLASALQTYHAPFNLSGISQGSNQPLPNGNVFVNWGQAGAITEFSHSGEVLFHAFLDSEPAGRFVQSYRGYRYNWTGFPTEPPAIAAIQNEVGGSVEVYVSWNGDTETAAWQFFSDNSTVPGLEGATFHGVKERRSFETQITVSDVSPEDTFFAVALDSSGKQIAISKCVSAFLESVPLTEETNETTLTQGVIQAVKQTVLNFLI